MNKMKEVAALLGVELGEEFELGGGGEFAFQHRLTVKGLEYHYTPIDWCPVNYIGKILSGELKIIKLPWKPKHRERCYCDCHRARGSSAGCFSFDSNDFHDLKNYTIGNCFKTKQEAEANADELREKLKKMYDDGVQMLNAIKGELGK